MSATVQHVGVVLRLMLSTRGGLVALLALMNTLPMVVMPVFFRGRDDWFEGGFTAGAFAISVLFAPLCRWALGSCLGQRGTQTSAALLPLSPRGRAVAEAIGILVAIAVPVSIITVALTAVVGVSPEAVAFHQAIGILWAVQAALALPHLLLASFDRESPYRHRLWIRWLAAPSLAALCLALPATHSFAGYVGVGVLTAAAVLAWGPAPWLAGGDRRQQSLPAHTESATREGASTPVAMLSHDFRRGLGYGAVRGLLWSLAIVSPLVIVRLWRSPEIAVALALVVAAVVAGRYPLGLCARVIGGQWANNGDFGRAWSTLPVPANSVARAVYLHIALCSAVILAVGVAVLGQATTDATTAGLLVTVAGLALVGIRTHSAVGSVRAWQWSWIVGAASLGCVWVARVALDSPRDANIAAGMVGVALLGAAAVSLSPAGLVRRQRA